MVEKGRKRVAFTVAVCATCCIDSIQVHFFFMNKNSIYTVQDFLIEFDMKPYLHPACRKV